MSSSFLLLSKQSVHVLTAHSAFRRPGPGNSRALFSSLGIIVDCNERRKRQNPIYFTTTHPKLNAMILGAKRPFSFSSSSANKENSSKAVYRALGGNLFITLLKFGCYFKTGSSAMLSEAIHTLVDCGNQVEHRFNGCCF